MDVSARGCAALGRTSGLHRTPAIRPDRTGACASRPPKPPTGCGKRATRDEFRGKRHWRLRPSRSSSPPPCANIVVLGCLFRSWPTNLSETVSATRELAKKCPVVRSCKPVAGGVYSYFQAKTGCSRSSTGSLRPSSPSHRSCNNTAPVGAWMRSFPRGICTTGRGLSGMVMKRGESPRWS
jgi:hypothetical protein